MTTSQTHRLEASAFEVERRRNGDPKRVKFYCPACRAPLTAPIDDAGNDDNCARCAAPIIVPGREVKGMMIAARVERDRAAAEEEERMREARRREAIRRQEHEQRKPAADAGGAPKYEGLWGAAAVLQGLGIVSILFGVIAAFAAADHIGGYALLLALSGVASGIWLIVIGYALQALRDIAINSWHIRAARTQVPATSENFT